MSTSGEKNPMDEKKKYLNLGRDHNLNAVYLNLLVYSLKCKKI